MPSKTVPNGKLVGKSHMPPSSCNFTRTANIRSEGGVQKGRRRRPDERNPKLLPGLNIAATSCRTAMTRQA